MRALELCLEQRIRFFHQVGVGQRVGRRADDGLPCIGIGGVAIGAGDLIAHALQQRIGQRAFGRVQLGQRDAAAYRPEAVGGGYDRIGNDAHERRVTLCRQLGGGVT